MTEKTIFIHTYTRKQALADGVLVDATETAREAGFRIPVALTCAAWAECVTVPDGVSGQSETGRLWDVLTMLRFAIKTGRESGTEIRFRVCQVNGPAGDRLVPLKAVIGPDDDGTPCLTIMEPHED